MKNRILMLVCLSGLFLIYNYSASGQDANDQKWEKFKWLLGAWKGDGTGQPGQGAGTFAFSYDLGGSVIVRHNHTEFPAMNGKPASAHDDLLIIYINPADNQPAAVYFDNEGHTIFYGISFIDNSIVLTSTRTGKMPVFRLTYTPVGSDSVDIAFDMSREDGKFVTYLEGKSKRIK